MHFISHFPVLILFFFYLFFAKKRIDKEKVSGAVPVSNGDCKAVVRLSEVINPECLRGFICCLRQKIIIFFLVFVEDAGSCAIRTLVKKTNIHLFQTVRACVRASGSANHLIMFTVAPSEVLHVSPPRRLLTEHQPDNNRCVFDTLVSSLLEASH